MASSPQQPKIRRWAAAVYVALLLENDSLVRAEGLLGDSILFPSESELSWVGAYYDLNKGVVHHRKAEYARADASFRSGLRVSSELPTLLRAHLLLALAENFAHQTRFDHSLQKWYEALRASEELGDSSLIADVHLGRSRVLLEQGEFEKAEADIGVFQRYHAKRKNRKRRADGISAMALLTYEKGNLDRAIEYGLESYGLQKQIGDLRGQGLSLHQLAIAQMGSGNWRQALRYLDEASQVKTHAGDLTGMPRIFNRMGQCQTELGKPVQALRYLRLALRKAMQCGDKRQAVAAYENMADLYVREGDLKAAMNTQSTLILFKDSLAALERNTAINELGVKYETEKKEQEIALLLKERTIMTNRWIMLAFGLSMTIVIGLLFIDRQKRKHAQEKQLLVAEDELQKAELKIMADLLEYNRKKLSLYTENLLKKNELVGELEIRLKETMEDAALAGTPEGKRFVADFSSLRILTDEDWDGFKELFEGVHQGLLEKLLKVYPDLTVSEQRLFLLMKLGLSTKEIANMLGVSPDSIKKGRYRLKRKIQVQGETSLQDFVTSFG